MLGDGARRTRKPPQARAEAPATTLASDGEAKRTITVAADASADRGRTLPLRRRLICEMHGTLMEMVRGGDLTPGQVRGAQVHIDARNSPIEQARFVPVPPGPDLDDAIRDLERYLHQPSPSPAIGRLGLVHYQFEAAGVKNAG